MLNIHLGHQAKGNITWKQTKMDFATRTRKQHFFGHLVVLFLVNCLAKKRHFGWTLNNLPNPYKQHNQTTNKWMKMNVKHPTWVTQLQAVFFFQQIL
jgi:hypothetical protein